MQDVGLIPGSGRCPGAGHGSPLQYSCLESPMDREAWQATFHEVTRSQTRLKWLISLNLDCHCARTNVWYVDGRTRVRKVKMFYRRIKHVIQNIRQKVLFKDIKLKQYWVCNQMDKQTWNTFEKQTYTNTETWYMTEFYLIWLGKDGILNKLHIEWKLWHYLNYQNYYHHHDYSILNV